MRVSSPLTLPNGVVLPNRVVKAAMSEYLADPATNRFNAALVRLYEAWAKTEAAILLTGNVMVTRQYMEAPTNTCVELADLGDPLLARMAKAAGKCKLVAQISHPGRQCPISISFAPVAPSPVALKVFPSAFVTPRALTEREIAGIVQQFADTAYVLREAGFAGVQLHAAHGYLLSTFLSPLYNQRRDRYGGSLENRMRVLLEIREAIRERLKRGGKEDSQFLVAVKLNSSDFQKGGFDEQEAVTVCQRLEEAGVAFVELSGGNYENAGDVFMKAASTREREGFFREISLRVKAGLSRMPVMLTGGFRTAQGMEEALRSGATDLVGLARPFAFHPLADLARLSRGEALEREPLMTPDSNLVPNTSLLRSINSGIQAVWYARQIERISQGRAPSLSVSKLYCLVLVVPKYFFHPQKSRIPFRWLFAALLAIWFFWRSLRK